MEALFILMRSLLTMLGIIMAASASVMVVMSIGEGARAPIEAQNLLGRHQHASRSTRAE